MEIFETIKNVVIYSTNLVALRILFVLAVIALIGSLIPTCFFVYTFVLGLLITPGIRAHGYDQKLWIQIKPNWEKISPVVQPYIDFIIFHSKRLFAVDEANAYPQVVRDFQQELVPNRNSTPATFLPRVSSTDDFIEIPRY